MVHVPGKALGAGVFLAIAAAGSGFHGDPPGPIRSMASSDRDFLARHWRRPIEPQGAPPTVFSPLERALAPESCGTCHPAQLADWKTALHSRSMGPGLTGQLVELNRTDPEGARACLTCHAPLAEQSEQIQGPRGGVSNTAFDPGLQRQGLTCAACHVRRHQRFGPPPREGSRSRQVPRSNLPHNGATWSGAFLRSEFCSSCHQFGPGDLRLGGKLLENTYEEWKASPAARQGLHCQHCHMPDRRHLWRGIHDPEMVKSGLAISLTTGRPRYRPGEDVDATLTIRSVRVGHYFPTYVTPRVVIRGELLDSRGTPISGSAKEGVVGRDVPLDLSREVSDTRIPPGGRFSFSYRQRLARPGLVLRVTVTVFPDHFYTRFFESLLDGGAGQGTAQIRQALAATRRSPFVIFSRDIPLT
jgi:hypothetical protein